MFVSDVSASFFISGQGVKSVDDRDHFIFRDKVVNEAGVHFNLVHQALKRNLRTMVKIIRNLEDSQKKIYYLSKTEDGKM